MNRAVTTIIFGLVGAFAGAYAVLSYIKATETPTCMPALNLIPAVIFGCPSGLTLGLCLGYSVGRRPIRS